MGPFHPARNASASASPPPRPASYILRPTHISYIGHRPPPPMPPPLPSADSEPLLVFKPNPTHASRSAPRVVAPDRRARHARARPSVGR
eukprot:scaffold44127_cov29-Tisochrysis_lutea.AAC.1